MSRKEKPKDPPESLPLTPNEQAFFDVLTPEPKLGKDILAELNREGFTNFDEVSISRMAKRPHLIARGVRHRRGAGYYKFIPIPNAGKPEVPAFGF